MSTTTTYAVTGMTCGHCISAVTEEVRKLAGVSTVHVELVPEGESVVTVTSDEPLPRAAVREAVDEAGYELVGASG
jgi:copper chaperone